MTELTDDVGVLLVTVSFRVSGLLSMAPIKKLSMALASLLDMPLLLDLLGSLSSRWHVEHLLKGFFIHSTTLIPFI